MTIEVTKFNGGYRLEFKTKNDLSHLCIDSVDYWWYSRREAIRRFRAYLKEKYPTASL